jgi:predicted phage tail protein
MAAGGYLTIDDSVIAMTMSIHPSYPSAPVNTTAEGAPGHAIVSWRPPTNTYGATVTGYRVTVFRGASKTVVSTTPVSGSATQTVITLPVGSYSVSVTAVTTNGVGASATTAVFGVNPTKGVRVPPAPRIMPSKVADRQVTVSWLPPVLSDGGSPIYQYVVSDGQGHGCAVGTDARVAVNKFSCTVTGLTNGRFYGFSVQAVNIMGRSVTSSVKVLGPASAPTSAPTLSVSEITAKRAGQEIGEYSWRVEAVLR